MKSTRRGKRTWTAKVESVSPEGFELRVGRRKYFLSFSHFPWFRDATIGEIANVQRPFEDELRWPELDVDLELDSLKHPERYPLIFGYPLKKRSRVAEPRANRAGQR